MTTISYDDYKKVEIRIGRILTVAPVEKSDRLLLLSVDFGEANPRTVVSGIAKYFPDITVLVDVTCPFVTNLEPRPLMGHTSEAMILAASTDAGEFSILRAEGIPPGTLVK
jgi:methionyl-tRNA synthetase